MRADEIKLPEGPGTRGNGNGVIPAGQAVTIRWPRPQQKALIAPSPGDGAVLYVAIDRDTCSATDFDVAIADGQPFTLGASAPQLFTRLSFFCATQLRYAPGTGQNASIAAWSI